MRSRPWVRLAALLLLAAPASAVDRDTGLARMVGVWQLDTRASEDPLQMLRQARQARPPLAERRRGEAREPAGALEMLERRATEALRGDAVLTFAYDEPSLRITYWDDRQRTLTVDGKPADASTDGGPARVEAEWKGSDRLVVKTEGGDGRRIEIFELGDRLDKLFVTVELYRKGRKQPFSYDRVYHRVTATD